MRVSSMNLSRLIIFFVAAFCSALSLRAEMADGVEAIVIGEVITYGQVDEITQPAAAALRREYAGQPDVFQQKLTDALADSLEQLIERQFILDDFETEYSKLPDSVVDELVQDH